MRVIAEYRRLLFVLMLIACAGASLSLAACHTVEGAGKDIQGLGEAVEDAADGDD